MLIYYKYLRKKDKKVQFERKKTTQKYFILTAQARKINSFYILELSCF
jgi:hypothetical protein